MNILTCPKCGKVLIQEEIESHECFFDVKSVDVEYYFEVKEKEEDTIVAKKKNGDFVMLIKSNLPLSDEKKQEDYSEWFRRRGNRTQNHEVYIPENFRRKTIND